MNIRKAKISDIPELAKVHVDSWRTTYQGIISDDFIRELSYKIREEQWKGFLKNLSDKQFIYVAEDAMAGIVGFIIGGPERSDHPIYKGELWGIYLLREFQRKKIGSLLIKTLIEQLINLNINTMLVWVLKDNPSCAFYEEIGGKYIDQKTTEIGNEKFMEISYGWDDLNELMKKLNKNNSKV